MKKVLFFLLIILFVNANEYEKWLAYRDKNFYQYKKSIDEEFGNQLKKDWEVFKTTYNPSPLEKLKPKIMPKAIKIKQTSVKKSKKIKKIDIKRKIIKPKIIKKIIEHLIAIKIDDELIPITPSDIQKEVLNAIDD